MIVINDRKSEVDTRYPIVDWDTILAALRTDTQQTENSIPYICAFRFSVEIEMVK